MMIPSRRLSVLILLGLLFWAGIIYLGVSAIRHEILTRHYQSLELARTRVQQISATVKSELTNKASHIEAMTLFSDMTPAAADHILQYELDIKNIFIIEGGQLIYPPVSRSYSEAERTWRDQINALVYDNSLLYSHYVNTENYQPKSGWFLSYDKNSPILIYWLYKENTLIGYQLSYAKLLLDMTALLDTQVWQDSYTISDYEQVLYSTQDNPDAEQETTQQALDYPLQNWQIHYAIEADNNYQLYWLGLSFMALFLAGFSALVFYCYRQYTQALRLARTQVNFVSQISHEFKTPLTNITLYSELLSEKMALAPEGLQRYVQTINSESKRLTRLIQNMLNFTKAPSLDIQTIDLNALTLQLYHTFAPLMATKKLSLRYYPFAGNSEINSDGDKVVQIISNFLNNAEKYAGQGEKVDLTINKIAAQYFSIKVRDYGEGIANNQLKAIFKPFYRVNSAITEGVAGTGLGLTIAKQLAEQLGGKIEVTNMYPGVAFSLYLPIESRSKRSTAEPMNS